jgi:hypothetical protein
MLYSVKRKKEMHNGSNLRDLFLNSGHVGLA